MSLSINSSGKNQPTQKKTPQPQHWEDTIVSAYGQEADLGGGKAREAGALGRLAHGGGWIGRILTPTAQLTLHWPLRVESATDTAPRSLMGLDGWGFTQVKGTCPLTPNYATVVS